MPRAIAVQFGKVMLNRVVGEVRRLDIFALLVRIKYPVRMDLVSFLSHR